MDYRFVYSVPEIEIKTDFKVDSVGRIQKFERNEELGEV